MLELKNISFGADSNGSYKEIIRDISLTIPDNRFVVITDRRHRAANRWSYAS